MRTQVVTLLKLQTDVTWKEAVRLRFGVSALTGDVADAQDRTRDEPR